MPGEGYVGWKTPEEAGIYGENWLEPEVRAQYIAQKREHKSDLAERRRTINEALAQLHDEQAGGDLTPADIAIIRSLAHDPTIPVGELPSYVSEYQSGGVVGLQEELPRLAGTAAASALYRQLMDKYGFTWPEEQLIPDFWKERASLDPVMAQSGGVVPSFGGQNMNGISFGPPRHPRPGVGNLGEPAIRMGAPRNTFPMPPLQPRSGITMAHTMPGRIAAPAPINASTQPAFIPQPGGGGWQPLGNWKPHGVDVGGVPGGWQPHGSTSTDTVPAMLTPGEGVLNTGAMSMIGEGPVNALNRMGRGFEEGGIVDDRSEEQLIQAGHTIYHPKTQEEADALPTGAYFKTPSGELMRALPESKGMLLEEGGIVPGYAGGTGSVGVSGRSPRREIGRGEFTRTDYGPGMGPIGRSAADLNEFTGSYGNKLGQNDVAVHPNNPFGVKPGPYEWVNVGGQWKHVADHLNRRLDPKKIDFYHPVQAGGGGGSPSRGVLLGGGDLGGGGLGGIGGIGGLPIGSGGTGRSDLMDPGRGYVNIGQMMGTPVPGAPGTGDLKRPWWMEEGGIVPGYAFGGLVGGVPGSGAPTRNIIGTGIGTISNAFVPGLGFITSPIARWLVGKIQSGAFTSSAFPLQHNTTPPTDTPPGGAPDAAPPELGGSGNYGWGLSSPLSGAGGPSQTELGLYGGGPSGMGPAFAGYRRPFLDKVFPGRGNPGSASLSEGGIVPGYSDGTTGVEPIGYNPPLEEQEWQKIIAMLPPNVDAAALKKQAESSGISPQALAGIAQMFMGGMGGAGGDAAAVSSLGAAFGGGV